MPSPLPIRRFLESVPYYQAFYRIRVMQLAEQDKIDIDKPLKEYIPGILREVPFPGGQTNNGARHSCHHSGLPLRVFEWLFFTIIRKPFIPFFLSFQTASKVCPSGQMFLTIRILDMNCWGYLSLGLAACPFMNIFDHCFVT